MADKAPQLYANHTRLDPAYHFFLLPAAAINVLAAIWNVIRNPGLGSSWFVVLSLAGAVLVLKCRLYPLKAQDRVIRLEERLRLASVLPDPLRPRIGELTESQLIALRFASDAELPVLVEKALAASMSNTEIKKAIGQWRPDYFRGVITVRGGAFTACTRRMGGVVGATGNPGTVLVLNGDTELLLQILLADAGRFLGRAER